MIDRIVHHGEMVTLKGASHRLRDSGLITNLPSAAIGTVEDIAITNWLTFRWAFQIHVQRALKIFFADNFDSFKSL